MRILGAAAVALLVWTAAACGGGFFRPYEYEEDMYLSLDGTATIYVNSSIAALNALRGTGFDSSAGARIDRDAIRDYFNTSNTHVNGRVTMSRRSNRQFIHVRVDVDDVTRLAQAAPFAWSRYDFRRNSDLYVYKQSVGACAGKDVRLERAGWNGKEVVAFRLHLPSKIDWHNSKQTIGRGNILVWEQSLSDRLRSAPVEVNGEGPIEARMQTESILYRTLWLFGWTFVAVAFVFGLVIWWMLGRPGRPVEEAG